MRRCPQQELLQQPTFFLDVDFASCGPSCPGTPTFKVSDISGDPKPGCKDTIFFRDLLCAGGDAPVKITAEVVCPDGETYKFDQVVSVPCVKCATLTATSELPLSEEPLPPRGAIARSGAGGDANRSVGRRW